jgi:hypothetical protein
MLLVLSGCSTSNVVSDEFGDNNTDISVDVPTTDSAGIGVIRPTTNASGVGGADSGTDGSGAQSCTPSIDQITFVEQLPNLFLEADANDAGIERARSGDFNDDGHMDLIITRMVFQTEIKSPMSFLLGNGTGIFYDGTDELFTGENPTAKHPAVVLIEDFNGDGVDDAYIGDSGMDAPPFPGTQNTLILSNGTGGMTEASSNLPFRSDQTHGAAAADIDLDGDVDIYVANLGGGGVQNYLLINDGNGVFSFDQSRIPEEAWNTLINWNTAAGFVDINNDGFPDLIMGQGDPNKKSHVVLNDGQGSFITPLIELPDTPLGSTDLVLDIQSADINFDGYVDLFLVYTTNDYVGRYIQFLINNGDETFDDETEARFELSTSGSWARFLQFEDMNNDGFLDITVGFLGEVSRLYINDGSGNFQEAKLNFDGGDLAIGDFDEDGSLDYVASGNSIGSSPEFFASFLNTSCLGGYSAPVTTSQPSPYSSDHAFDAAVGRWTAQDTDGSLLELEIAAEGKGLFSVQYLDSEITVVCTGQTFEINITALADGLTFGPHDAIGVCGEGDQFDTFLLFDYLPESDQIEDKNGIHFIRQ